MLIEYNPNNVIKKLETYSIEAFNYLTPTLGIVVREDAPQSDVYYLNSLKSKAEKYGAKIDVRKVKTLYDAALAIQQLREDIEISGIIIISSFDEKSDRALANMIPVRLDIDCVSASAIGQLVTNTSPVGFRLGPCTAIACYKIIEDYLGTDDFKTKNIAIINRSLRVGRPLAEILTQHNATVTVYHSKSDMPQDLSDYNIIITATGQPEWLDENYCQRYSDLKLIIDVSTIETEKGLVGDVDLQSFYDQGYDAENCTTNLTITPVPGGVGRITPVVLFAKLFQNAAIRHGEILSDV